MSPVDTASLDKLVAGAEYGDAWREVRDLCSDGNDAVRDRAARWLAFQSPLLVDWLGASINAGRQNASQAEQVWDEIARALDSNDGWLAQLWGSIFFRDNAAEEMLARARSMTLLARACAHVAWGDSVSEVWPDVQQAIQTLTGVCVPSPAEGHIAEVARRVGESASEPPPLSLRMAPLFRHGRRHVQETAPYNTWKVAWAMDVVRRFGDAAARGNSPGATDARTEDTR